MLLKQTTVVTHSISVALKQTPKRQTEDNISIIACQIHDAIIFVNIARNGLVTKIPRSTNRMQ